MNITKQLQHPWWRFLLVPLCWWAGGALPATATSAKLTIDNYAFNPSAVTINVDDQVNWAWSSDGTPHSTTSDTGLWDSGLNSSPHSYSMTFRNAGTYSYYCTLHTFMTGAVTVQAANAPPTVSLVAPTNGATFAAPWTGTVKAAVADPDGTVTKVEFHAGTTVLGVVNNPGANPSLTVTNLAAGNYTLTAVATDNGGATTTSAGVTIHVVQPAMVKISAPQRLSSTAFQFSYGATPGLTYIIQRSTQLPNFTPVATNLATAATQTFRDNNANGALNFYRVKLAPNP